jgi:hypothetical protein
MLPPFLGQLLTVFTAGIAGAALLVAIWARMKGNRFFFRAALAAGSSVVAVYGLFFGLGLLLARDRLLPPGEAVRFCGLDCHLHVQVAEARPGEVVVRFSSNAVRVPEWPRELEFALLDAEGKRHAPVNQVPDRPVLPEESWTHSLRFAETANVRGASLVVTWKRGLDYLVPGAGNPLVQRHTRLVLPGG